MTKIIMMIIEKNNIIRDMEKLKIKILIILIHFLVNISQIFSSGELFFFYFSFIFFLFIFLYINESINLILSKCFTF
jgi:hypothetical protein